jgi:uncharacterized Ntn-hydrolase superfamily protein
MTFSIVAGNAGRSQFGVAVASKFLAVGSVVPAARAGAGALATQAWANTAYRADGIATRRQYRTPANPIPAAAPAGPQRTAP